MKSSIDLKRILKGGVTVEKRAHAGKIKVKTPPLPDDVMLLKEYADLLYFHEYITHG